MRALITGSQGFVGRYLRQELEANGYEVIGLDLQEAPDTIQADLLDADQMRKAITEVKPDAVFHLAGQPDVAKSWKIPQKTIEINVVGTLNLLETVRALEPTIRIVTIGSSDQYGNLGEAGQNVKEDLDTKPQTPYAVSKKAQEELAQLYAKVYGMNICMTRSFNHGGAGQRLGFLIPDLAAGIVKVETGQAQTLKVGNLTSRRDFTHVKDIVRAYRLLAEKGRPGEIYNIGSGITYSAQEILDKLCAMSAFPITVEQDPARMRPSDTPVICCDHSKLTEDTGWEPEIPLDVMLGETLEGFRRKEEQGGI